MTIPFLYNARHLGVRQGRTILTVLGIGLVVAVFCYLICFAQGLRRALAVTGDPHNLIVLAESATAESNSAVSRSDFRRLLSTPNLALEDDQRPLASPEVVVQANVTRRGDAAGTYASVAMRGVYIDLASDVHRQVRLVQGRWFRAGADEIVVGTAAAQRFKELDIGSWLDCGERRFQVVGMFQSAGSVHDSECWGHLPNVAEAYRRLLYSSAVLRMESAEDHAVDRAIERVASAGVALRGVREPDYYASQTSSARLVEAAALALVVLMAGGAVLAAMNSMHASVAGRHREIGMLRAIGFSPASITLGLLGESLAIAWAGGLLGCLGCAGFVALQGGMNDLVGTATFTSVAFSVRVSGLSVLYSLIVATAVGLLGGLGPARTGGRIPIVRALRTA